MLLLEVKCSLRAARPREKEHKMRAAASKGVRRRCTTGGMWARAALMRDGGAPHQCCVEDRIVRVYATLEGGERAAAATYYE